MILLYHLVFPDSTPPSTYNAGDVLRLADYKRHMLWLKKHFEIISLQEYLHVLPQSPARLRKKIALTFDDGYRSTLELVLPFLEEQQIPATFFLTTAHLIKEELLWFVYFNALCFEDAYAELQIQNQPHPLSSKKSRLLAWRKLIDLARQSGDAIAFSTQFAQNYPLPGHIIHKYQGLTVDQIAALGKSELFEIGGHTHNHPYLDQISGSAQLVEILQNKGILEGISGKSLRFFAYTGGVYNAQSIEAVKKARFEAALSVIPRNFGSDPLYELPRIDIYSPSLMKLKLKVFGLLSYIYHFGLKGN